MCQNVLSDFDVVFHRAGGLSSSQSGQGQASGFQTTGIAVDVAGASSGALQSSAAVLGQPRE